MQQPSRRTLLAGTGTAIALGTAGVVGGVLPSDANADGQSRSLPSGLESALEYVFPPDDGGPVLRITRIPDDPSENRAGYHHTQFSEFGTPEWVVVDTAVSGSRERRYVAVGSFEVSADSDRYGKDGTRGDFDLYRRKDEEEERVFATDGEALLAGSEEWVASTLDSHAAGERTYLAATEGVRSLLGTVDFTGQATLVDDEAELERPFEEAGIDTAKVPDRILAHFARTDETIDYALAGWYAELPDDPVAPLETFVSEQLSVDDISTDVDEDDGIVVVRASRPYTPPEERPETVDTPHFHEYDEEAGEVLLRFDRGEQLPVDRYTLEIDGETYEGDWARDQEEIGEGSIIAIDADAIDPGDEFTISYEAPDGGYSSARGTTVLRHLPFDVEFDPNARTAELEYVDGPPLAGDRLGVVVHGGEGDDDAREPWSGEVESGDAVTLSDLPLEGHVTVEYERADGEPIRIGGAPFGPPGRFTFEYDGQAETLTITYPEPPEADDDHRHPEVRHRRESEPLDADQFEITVDGNPADRQWSDADGTIEPGDSLTVQDVPVDTNVSVNWIAADGTRHEVASEHTVPDVTFEFDYDADARELTVTHASGPSVDAGKLSVRLHGETDRTVEWGDDGSVADGDQVVVEDVPERGFVIVTYRETPLDHAPIRETTDDE